LPPAPASAAFCASPACAGGQNHGFHLGTPVLSAGRAHGERTMGDKSPKSMRKQADQKQTKTDDDNRKKQAAVTAKQVAAKKK
jgi:hypothetical protein